MVRVFPCHGDSGGTCSEKDAPGAKRRSRASAQSSILRAPLRPCALVSRPTRRRRGLSSVTLVIGINNINPPSTAIGERRHEGAQCLGGATRATDDAAQV